MVSFSMTGLLLHVALFPSGTTHDCAIGQAGPSIWSRLPPAILHRDPMKVRSKKQSGPLLVSSFTLVSAKTRKRGANDDQSDPHRRLYRSDHAVPVPRLQAGEQRVEARVYDQIGRE